MDRVESSHWVAVISGITESPTHLAATLRRRFLMLTPLSRPVSGIKKFRDWEAYEQWQADPNNSRQR